MGISWTVSDLFLTSAVISICQNIFCFTFFHILLCMCLVLSFSKFNLLICSYTISYSAAYLHLRPQPFFFPQTHLLLQNICCSGKCLWDAMSLGHSVENDPLLVVSCTNFKGVFHHFTLAHSLGGVTQPVKIVICCSLWRELSKV